MKSNIAKKEIESGKSILDLLIQTDPELHPHHLKSIISDYQHFKLHCQKYGLWSSTKPVKNKNSQRYDKILLLVSGITAGGKDAIREEINRLSPNLFHKTVTGTSRLPRPDETEGKDYYFFNNPKNFRQSIKAGEFIEYIKQGDRYYGLPKKSLEESIKHPSPVIWSQVEMSAWSKLEKHLNTISEIKIKTVKIFILPQMRFSTYQNWLNQKRNDDNNSRLIRTGWEIKKAPKKADYIISNRIKENTNCLTYTAQTIINQLLEYLVNPPHSKFPLPFDLKREITEIEEIIQFHDSLF